MDEDAAAPSRPGVAAYLPAQINTAGELAILLAGLPADTPLRLPGTARIDPMTLVTGYGIAAPVASIDQLAGDDPHGFALRLGLLVLADPDRPAAPEDCPSLNPLDRLHEALVGDGDHGAATVAAAETLHRVVEYLEAGRFPERVGGLVEQLRQLAGELVDESAIIELEKDL